MIAAVKKTTPFSPNPRWILAITTSYNHSHAYQVCPPLVTENGSVRVTEWVCSICSPLRICQPMLASPNKRVDRAPPLIATSKVIKIRSVVEGARNRNHAGDVVLRGRPSICAAFESKSVRTQPHMLTENRELK